MVVRDSCVGKQIRKHRSTGAVLTGFISVVLTCLLSWTASGQTLSEESLLANELRPTALEVMDATLASPPYLSHNVDEAARTYQMSLWETAQADKSRDFEALYRQRINTKLAPFIVDLERHFPGAIVVAVGRDSSYVGELIDAYYNSRGEPGRVIRLDASRRTLYSDRESLLLYLRQQGVELNPALVTRPYIFIDRTEFQVDRTLDNTSQLLRLISAVYHGAQKQGFKAAAMYRKFNVVALNPIVPRLPRSASLSDQFLRFSSVPGTMSFYSGASVFKRTTVQGEELIYPSHLYESDLAQLVDIENAVWTESFAELEARKDGTLAPDIPPPAQNRYRETALSLIRKGGELVSSPEFAANVQAIGAERGFVLPAAKGPAISLSELRKNLTAQSLDVRIKAFNQTAVANISAPIKQQLLDLIAEKLAPSQFTEIKNTPITGEVNRLEFTKLVLSYDLLSAAEAQTETAIAADDLNKLRLGILSCYERMLLLNRERNFEFNETALLRLQDMLPKVDAMTASRMMDGITKVWLEQQKNANELTNAKKLFSLSTGRRLGSQAFTATDLRDTLSSSVVFASSVLFAQLSHDLVAGVVIMAGLNIGLAKDYYIRMIPRLMRRFHLSRPQLKPAFKVPATPALNRQIDRALTCSKTLLQSGH